MSRLDEALEALRRVLLLNEPEGTAFWQTVAETPRSRPPQSSQANDQMQKINT
jgi:hypothetical protein